MRKRKTEKDPEQDNLRRRLEELSEQLEQVREDEDRVDIVEELQLQSEIELLEAEIKQQSTTMELEAMKRKRSYLPNHKYKARWFLFFQKKAELFGQKRAFTLTSSRFAMDINGDETDMREKFCRAYRRWRKTGADHRT